MKLNKTLSPFLLLLFFHLSLSAVPQVRIKDIAYLQGIRNNQLTGIGLVTGLGGKGDSSSSEMLKKTITNLLSGFNIFITPEEVKSKNCAVVMVTVEIPPFIRPGDRIDLTVSSIGDAKSLEDGVLLQTNLKGANGNVYATAQGKIVSPGKVKTVGTITGGGIVEREVLSSYISGNQLRIVLRNPDFVTANALGEAIKARFPEAEISTRDAAMVEVTIPEDRRDDSVSFIAEMEALTLTPDTSGKVVIDPQSDIIIVGEQVRIGKVAVSYKQVDVNVGTYSSFDEDENPDNFVFDETTSVEDFIKVLRTVGLKTDIITGILQAIDKAGALYGKLIIM